MSYIQELQDMIRRIHGVESEHVESVPVKESFQGKTFWEGIVEVFELRDHPEANLVYAWAHDTENPDKPRRHVTVLHIHPIKSARDAVRAAIVQEFNSGTAEDSGGKPNSLCLLPEWRSAWSGFPRSTPWGTRM